MAEPVDLTWSALTCDVMSQKTHRLTRVLQHAVGTVKPGEMMALVGPSGAGLPWPVQYAPLLCLSQHAHRLLLILAGKSTLLDILAMRKSTGTLAGHVSLTPRSRISCATA